ncbi:MAG TPA: hypothetical protein ENJ28_01245 [Gammaproteobacteria bacterium]|nr:hypothetical protein [Gammaproteobacteria bacterium]
MASRYDIFYQPQGDINWKEVLFPDEQLHAIPKEIGVYRFVCFKLEKWITLFVDVSEREPCETLRSSYQFHNNQSKNDTSQLYELYSTENVQFEHYSCTINEAKRHKNNLLIKESPKYNSIRLTFNLNQGEKAFQ